MPGPSRIVAGLVAAVFLSMPAFAGPASPFGATGTPFDAFRWRTSVSTLGSLGGIVWGPGGLLPGLVPVPAGQDGENSLQDESAASDSGSAFEAYVARIKADDTALLAGPDEKFPSLRKAVRGDLVVVVQKLADWCAVEVPQGYVAYIHGRYVKPVGHGLGQVTANGVNLRPRPSSNGDNLPIDTLDRGTAVFMLGSTDGWVEVGAPPIAPLWVKSSKIERAGDVETFSEEVRKIRAEAEKKWLVLIGPDPAEAARVERLAKLQARLDSARGRFEKARDDESADAVGIGLIAVEFEAVAKEALGLGSAEARDLAKTGNELASRARALEGKRHLPVESITAPDNQATGTGGHSAEEKGPEKGAEAAGGRGASGIERPELAPLPGSRFTGVGWIEFWPGDREAPIHLKKGGQAIYRLTCRSGRYRLADFRGKEVGVVGPVRPVAGAPDLVEVERLEIIAR